MAMTNIKSELWASKLTLLLRKTLVAMGVVNTNLAGEINRKGDTLHIIGAGEVAVADYPTSANITYEDPSDTNTDLSIDIDKYFAIKVEDADVLQAAIPWQSFYSSRGGYQLASAYDALLLAEYASAGLNSYETGTTAWQWGTAAADVPKFLAAVMKQLDDADALSLPGMPYMILPTIAIQGIRLYVTTRATALGDKILMSGMGRNGFIGELGGFNIYMSRNCTSASSVVHGLAGIEGEGIAAAIQIDPNSIESMRLEGRFATGVRGRLLGGIATYRSGTMIDINLNTTLLA